jgi:hypothetical protein
VVRKRKFVAKLLTLLAIAVLSVVATRAVVAAVHEPTMSAEQALKLLLEGNQRFVDGKLEHPNQTAERRAEVAKGQHPFAAVLRARIRERRPKLFSIADWVTYSPCAWRATSPIEW